MTKTVSLEVNVSSSGDDASEDPTSFLIRVIRQVEAQAVLLHTGGHRLVDRDGNVVGLSVLIIDEG
jgi:hypothetical protein